jgi:hypothetical protein
MPHSLRLLSVAVGVGAAVIGSLASAHHSQVGIFDSRETIEVTGVIKTISWRNPHGQILLTATNPDGTETEWDAETASIAVMRNRGAEPSAVVVGDRVTIAGAPSVRGRKEILATSSHSAGRRRTSPKARAGGSSAARRSKPTYRKRRRRPMAFSASGRRT